MELSQRTVERFWSKVNRPSQADECWIWTAGLMRSGYGRFYVPALKQPRGAHRISYELSVGPVPPDLCVLHRCDNPPCVNPQHLWLGTRDDNNRDMRMKRRDSRGDRHFSRTRPEALARGTQRRSAKLAERDIPVIAERVIAGDTYRAIAADYGVSESVIYKIVRGTGWRHVTHRPIVVPVRKATPENPHPGTRCLTHEQAEEIRQLHSQGMNCVQLANMFGVSAETARRIVKRLMYKG